MRQVLSFPNSRMKNSLKKISQLQSSDQYLYPVACKFYGALFGANYYVRTEKLSFSKIMLVTMIWRYLDFRVLFPYRTAPLSYPSIITQYRSSRQFYKKCVKFSANVLDFSLNSKAFSLHLLPLRFPNLKHLICVLMQKRKKIPRITCMYGSQRRHFCLFC